jgi:RHS repeat-associated protein
VVRATTFAEAPVIKVAWHAATRDALLAPDQRAGDPPATAWLGSLVEDQRDVTGLTYRRNRYYEASSGRFTQVYPIGLAGGLTTYGYAGGDPLNFADPYEPCPKGARTLRAYGEGTNTIKVCEDKTEGFRSPYQHPRQVGGARCNCHLSRLSPR